MTSSHVFFIPAILLAGAILGYVMGRKLLLAEQQETRAAEERKAARRAAKSDAS